MDSNTTRQAMPHLQAEADVSSIRRFILHTVNYLPAALLPALFAIVGSAIYTRIFTPSEYGILSLVLAVTGPLTTVLTEWIGQPVGRFYAEYKQQGLLVLYRRVVGIIVEFIVALVVVIA